MEINLDTSARPPRLTLSGEMTIYAAALLKESLLTTIEDCPELEIDLAKVSEIDTAGLQLLILAKRQAAASDKTLTLIGHSHPVLELLELYNMASFFGDPVVITAQESSGGKA